MPVNQRFDHPLLRRALPGLSAAEMNDLAVWAKRGSRKAANEFHRRTLKLTWRACLKVRRLYPSHADDIFSSALEGAQYGLLHWSPELGACATSYVFTAARHASAWHIKGQMGVVASMNTRNRWWALRPHLEVATQAQASQALTDNDFEQRAAGALTLNAVASKLPLLSDRSRSVVNTALAGWTWERIGAELGVTRQAAKQTWEGAVAELQRPAAEIGLVCKRCGKRFQADHKRTLCSADCGYREGRRTQP